ncbi:VOC family protein [Micromonospora auratinigra]|uniref:PhnB protein n=1 Tax=Micromonospora auratinigra TaxID=261654 RepID=A0A1A8ZAJ1_9ACTN|nr:VOC family protein [Micromonospora auratinigra]SBT40989.1 PhnB protein [Micromonospora auratinigra]
MGSRLNPYLSFRGDARAAMEFYRDVFGGELQLMTFGEMGGAEPALAEQIMHGLLRTDRGYVIMGSDAPPGMELHPGDNVSLILNGDNADELTRCFGRLSEGGSVSVALEKQMWGDVYGACVDRFGTHWMVNISQSWD